MNEMNFCQSCGMPLARLEGKGTNADRSVNEEYCTYCFKGGAFTAAMTMSEMIEFCILHISKGEPYADEESARKAMNEFFSTSKRWS